MAKITFLGTANAMPDKNHESAHFLIETTERVILVDCAGNPVVRLDQAGRDPLLLTDIILTHFHPDHVAGLPLLLLDLLIMGRTDPIHIHGLKEVIDRVVQLLEVFDWQDWGDFFPVIFHPLPEEERTPALDTDAVKIWTSPVCHSIPTVGLRVQFPGGVVCYSCDTAPCNTLVRLADGADILIHEATGKGKGHSSPEQAGEMAQKAGVGKLVLIHYPTKVDLKAWVSKAKRQFSGEVIAASDWMEITI